MVQVVPEFHLGIDPADPPSRPPSSHGFAPDCGKYPVDDITENTPCTLHMTLGKRGKTLMKVADGIATPERTFHTVPIPQECARVQIIKVDDKYLTCELDYPNEEEGIETLEDAINQFILWP
ncbi:hydroxyproline-rich glycoprotein-like [Panicum miliaceum]|uniref:Hydroxyproline-rich glycoprotein-like n=1 Tax=Panicum miliaceum TaxID=4540 RepID=A0A3L6QD21_PANMI|nr:hydroxyproline-rich glycoprotein-like [Panicum miliaceum]